MSLLVDAHFDLGLDTHFDLGQAARTDRLSPRSCRKARASLFAACLNFGRTCAGGADRELDVRVHPPRGPRRDDGGAQRAPATAPGHQHPG